MLYSHILNLPVQYDQLSVSYDNLLKNDFGIPYHSSSMIIDSHFDLSNINTVKELILFHSHLHSNASLSSILLHDSSISWIIRLLFESRQIELFLHSTAWFQFYLLLCHDDANKITFEYILTSSLISSAFKISNKSVYWPIDKLYNLSIGFFANDSKRLEWLQVQSAYNCISYFENINNLTWIPSSNICKQIEDDSGFKIRRTVNFRLLLIELATHYNSVFSFCFNLSFTLVFYNH